MPQYPEGKIGLYVYVDQILKRQLLAICKLEGKTVYEVVESLIRDYVEEKLKQGGGGE